MLMMMIRDESMVDGHHRRLCDGCIRNWDWNVHMDLVHCEGCLQVNWGEELSRDKGVTY